MTIVLPCFNEGEHVMLEIERISAVMDGSGLSYELLCIDDASTDDSVAVIEACHDPRIRVLRHPQNRGAGPARAVPSA